MTSPRFLVLILSLTFLVLPALAESEVAPLEQGWPKTIEAEGATFTVFQPQLESWDRYTFEAHSAIAVKDDPEKAAVYGVVFFKARTQVDKQARIVVFDALEILGGEFPANEDKNKQVIEALGKRLADEVRSIDLDRLEASLALVEAESAAREVPARHEPPEIVFAETPTLLVLIDGEPAYREIKDTKYERILNTRPLVLRDSKGKHYLHVYDGWLEAESLAGPWTVVKKPRKSLRKAQEKTLERVPADLLEGGEGKDKPTIKEDPVPAILVAVQPTEVIVSDGAANYVPIEGTKLLFVENTTGHVFKLLTDQQNYVLISGRWFSSESLDGPWTFVPQDKLSEEFAKIPDESPKENVKASVAGTAQAQEALISNSIPEMAKVKRSEAKFIPNYDGVPKFEEIESTGMAYAANSPDPIIRVDAQTYYAVHNGVWFMAPRAEGPWTVAIKVPSQIYSIPTSSPVHYVTYVKIYDSTPDVVVVGYAPGYYGTVVVDGVVVYGTGYYHSPWIGSYYYGHPYTYGWGCSITYSPWSGWSFSFGIGWGWGYAGWYAPYPHPYWGPYYGWAYPSYYGGFAYGARGGYAAWGPGGWAGTTGNIYSQWGSTTAVTRRAGGFDAWSGTGWREQVGMAYNSRTGTLAAGQRAAVGNIYTGEYAYGSRGVAAREGGDKIIAGSRGTIGDVDTGREISGGRGAIYDRETGETKRIGGVRGEDGGALRVGDDVYAGRDGEVYRRNDKGDWQKVDRSGQWEGVKDRAKTRDLDRQSRARKSGSERRERYQRGSRSIGERSRGQRSRPQRSLPSRGGGRRR